MILSIVMMSHLILLMSLTKLFDLVYMSESEDGGIEDSVSDLEYESDSDEDSDLGTESSFLMEFVIPTLVTVIALLVLNKYLEDKPKAPKTRPPMPRVSEIE